MKRSFLKIVESIKVILGSQGESSGFFLFESTPGLRVKTKLGKQIDVEIQILPTDYMAERTIFYWSKMYTSQIKPGDTYDKLKKCVTINIVDFKCTPLKKLYSSYHITEDKTGYKLTDILEVHFLEIPKLFDDDIERDENDAIVQWMEPHQGNNIIKHYILNVRQQFNYDCCFFVHFYHSLSTLNSQLINQVFS